MAIKNITDLNTQLEILLPDNTRQLISPADVREAIKDLNDSAINRVSDASVFGLRTYNTSRTYEEGEGTFYNGVIYQANQVTSGVFNPAHWDARSSGSGTWGGIAGTITDQTDLMAALNAKQNTLTTNMPLFKTGSVLNIQQATSSQNGYLSAADWALFNSKESGLTVSAPLLRSGSNLHIQYVDETQDGVLSSENWILLNTGFIDISYSDAQTTKTNSLLKKGKYYKITTGTRINEGLGTRGDIIVQSIDTNRFDNSALLITRIARYESIGTSIMGIWTPSILPTTGNQFIYNGLVYLNLTGAVGTAPDLDTTNWELIDRSNTTFYKTEIDSIEYDFDQDWIYYRADKRGNRVSFAKLASSGTNAIDRFQWGNDVNYSNIVDNGILDNLNSTVQYKLTNLTKSGIYKSEATTTNRTYTFRDQDGVVAFLSDIGDHVVIDITHADLLDAIDNSTLVKGLYYRITDFQTIHVIPQTIIVNTGSIEAITVQAVSDNAISTSAYSEAFPNDSIEYNINDLVAEDLTTVRKGKITYRKDRVNNLETWYDFRAVKFRRWQVDGAGMSAWSSSTSYSQGQLVIVSNVIYKALSSHTSTSNFSNDVSNYKWGIVFSTPSGYVAWKTSLTEFGGTILANSGLFDDYLTFASGSKNISIKKSISQPYNNIVYLTAGSGDNFDTNCLNFTILNGANQNTFGKDCNGMIFSGGPAYNKIGNSCAGFFFLNGSYFNTIQDSCQQIFFNSSANYNILEGACQNIFLTSVSGNIIGKDSYYNFLSSGGNDNILDQGSNRNIITNGSNNNSLGQSAANNFFTNGSQNNKLGPYSTNNSFSNSSSYNTLGTYCNANSFSSASQFNTLNTAASNNSFTSASSNSLGQSSSNNSFASNANGNSVGNKSEYNAFGLNSVGNRLGNYCISNQVVPSSTYYTGVSGQYNVFENYCSNNVISGNNNYLGSYCNFIQCASTVFLSNCLFTSGLQNIAFSGTFITENLKVMLARDVTSTLTINSTSAARYKNIVVDMKDSTGTLWYKNISTTGRIITRKFN